jgi:hypothetical protein
MRLASVLALVAVVVSPSLAHAQNALPAAPTLPAVPPSPAAVASDSAVRNMRTVLRQLAGAEERYVAEHGTYTTDVAALGLFDLAAYRGGRTSRVTVTFAGGRSWSAESRHVSLEGRSCVMYVGDAASIPGGVPTTLGAHLAAEQRGAPTCDSGV